MQEPAVPPAEAKLRTQWHAEGTSKGGTSGNDFDKKKVSEKTRGEKRERERTRRDDAIHSRDEGGRIHVSLILVPSLSFKESGFSLPWRPHTTIQRFLLPATLLQMRPTQNTPLLG